MPEKELTTREEQILRLIRLGFSWRQIGDLEHISVQRVAEIVRHIRRKGVEVPSVRNGGIVVRRELKS